MGKTFVLGDVHGAHLALMQVLERSGFNKEEDTLITLGDICDGWPYVAECVEILLTIKNRIDIIGNHDEWFSHYLNTGIHPDQWKQGGTGTLRSYLHMLGKENMIHKNIGGYISSLIPGDISLSHWKFFAHQIPYYKDEKDRVFTHAGFFRWKTLIQNRRDNITVFYWDRDFWTDALSSMIGKGKTPLSFRMEPISEVFIGHTSTENWNTDKPMHADIVWNIDTGSGWGGKLTIMDVDTHEFWQSDNVKELYPDEKGR
jgi:serine/threonine protein phosphatase 1